MASKTPSKRPHQEEESHKHTPNNTKKPRKSEDGKPISTPAFTRVWSDEDEVSLLNGMIRYKAQKGLDPHSDMGAFHSFMMGKMGSFSKEQMRSKMKRLRKRFLNARKKGRDGEDPVFSNPHEDALFEISKKVWGEGGGVENGEKGGNVGFVEENVVVEEGGNGEGEGDEGFWLRYPFLSTSFDRLLGGFGMSFVKGIVSSRIGDAKAKELEKKWKKLVVMEAELECKKLALMAEELKRGLNQYDDVLAD